MEKMTRDHIMLVVRGIELIRESDGKRNPLFLREVAPNHVFVYKKELGVVMITPDIGEDAGSIIFKCDYIYDIKFNSVYNIHDLDKIKKDGTLSLEDLDISKEIEEYGVFSVMES